MFKIETGFKVNSYGKDNVATIGYKESKKLIKKFNKWEKVLDKKQRENCKTFIVEDVNKHIESLKK